MSAVLTALSPEPVYVDNIFDLSDAKLPPNSSKLIETIETLKSIYLKAFPNIQNPDVALQLGNKVGYRPWSIIKKATITVPNLDFGTKETFEYAKAIHMFPNNNSPLGIDGKKPGVYITYELKNPYFYLLVLLPLLLTVVFLKAKPLPTIVALPLLIFAGVGQSIGVSRFKHHRADLFAAGIVGKEEAKKILQKELKQEKDGMFWIKTPSPSARIAYLEKN